MQITLSSSDYSKTAEPNNFKFAHLSKINQQRGSDANRKKIIDRSYINLLIVLNHLNKE